jgi:kynurenine formamidase
VNEMQTAEAPLKSRRSWRIIAVTTLLAVVATVGFTAAADSFDFRVRGGAGGGAALACPGGMDRLAHPFDEGFTTVFPGDPEVMVEIVNTIPVDFFLLEKVTTGTHGGTHLDAPRHFVETGRSVDQLDATEFVWPAYVIDVRDRVAAEGPDFQLEKADIRDYERANGRINKGSMVIIHTGHDELFGTAAYASTSHPGFSGDAVQWMIGKRWIGGLGSDGLGPDATIDFDFLATFTMLDADGVAIPGLNNLDTMNAKGDIIIASAVPLVGGSGYQVDPLACHGSVHGHQGDTSWDEDDDGDDD